MSEESPTYNGGSLDHFEDLTDKLDELGVSYVLLVGVPGQSVTRSWSNVRDFGPPALRNMEAAFQQHMEKVSEMLDRPEE